MTTYPKSPKEMTDGMMYFPRMLDKIRLHLRRELHEDYRRGGVAAQPWRDDAVGFGEVLEERDGGRRVIGEAVEEEEPGAR